MSADAPYPVLGLSGKWTPFGMANGPARVLLGGLDHYFSTRQNYMRVLLAPGPVRDSVENWPHVAHTMLVRLRRRIGKFGTHASR